MKNLILMATCLIISNIGYSQAPVSYHTGSNIDIEKKTQGGLLLLGGSSDVDEAFAWFLQRSGGGDVVVIRASGADGYNQYLFNLVPVNSVETIIIDSREKANLPGVAEKIRNAEALFISGGDQSNYVNYWKNSATEDAINFLINTKKAPVGGTSAGLAILGSAYYSALYESATSTKTLADPYYKDVTLGADDFLITPFLKNTITDSHYSQRDRMGRHIAFMARIMKDFGYTTIRGIGIDEQTAVCIDQNGIGTVFGLNSAYFLWNNGQGPETCISSTPLTWNRNTTAINAYIIPGNKTGNGSFNSEKWTFTGGTTKTFYVNNGVLSSH